jgi:hypothetical protein
MIGTQEVVSTEAQEVEYIGMGDQVLYEAECVRYIGEVIAVDYQTERALLSVMDKFGSRSFWAGVERLSLLETKTAVTAAALTTATVTAA